MPGGSTTITEIVLDGDGINIAERAHFAWGEPIAYIYLLRSQKKSVVMGSCALPKGTSGLAIVGALW